MCVDPSAPEGFSKVFRNFSRYGGGNSIVGLAKWVKRPQYKRSGAPTRAHYEHKTLTRLTLGCIANSLIAVFKTRCADWLEVRSPIAVRAYPTRPDLVPRRAKINYFHNSIITLALARGTCRKKGQPLFQAIALLSVHTATLGEGRPFVGVTYPSFPLRSCRDLKERPSARCFVR